MKAINPFTRLLNVEILIRIKLLVSYNNWLEHKSTKENSQVCKNAKNKEINKKMERKWQKLLVCTSLWTLFVFMEIR